MGGTDIIDIHSPEAGLDRRFAFQASPGPYSVPDEQNCRNTDTFEERRRLASRPGLAKAYTTASPIPLGSGSPIRMMAQCRSINSDPASSYSETFSAAFGGDWAAPPWTSYSGILPTIAGGMAAIGPLPGATTDREAILTGVTTVSTSARRSVAILVPNTTSFSTSGLQVYSVFLDSRSAASGKSEGIFLYAHVLSTSTTLYLQQNGAQVEVASVTSPSLPAWLKLEIDSSNIMRCYWTNTTTPDITYSASYTPAYALAGFWIEQNAAANTPILVDQFRLEYTSNAGTTGNRFLVPSANGTVYYEKTDGTFGTASGATLASDRMVQAAPRLQSLYIADNGTLASGTDGVITNNAVPPTTFDFDSATYTDWTNISGVTVVVGDYLRITSGSVTLGDYRIQSVVAAKLTAVQTGALAGPGNGTNLTFKVIRGPKVFTASTTAVTLLAASTMLVPPGCRLVATWRDRIVLAGDPDNPQRAYMSKRSDPTNWTYANTTPDSAYAFSTAQTAAEIGDSITALLSHRDDYLLFGCANSLYIQRGDPTYGGSLDVVATGVGVVSGGAWCITPEGYAVILGADGLYAIAPTNDAVPERLSRERIPKELIDLSASLYDVQMAYDVRYEGIHLFVTPISAGSTTHWWFEWKQKAFRKVSLSSSQEPTASCVHTLTGSDTPVVLLGGRDGYIRQFSQGASTDDGTTFTSYSLIGPIMLGGNGYSEGMIREVVGQLSTLSGTVELRIQVGDSAESAYRATSRVLYTMRAGKGRTYRPNLRGNACFLKLSATSPWALEQLSIVRERLGKQRLLT